MNLIQNLPEVITITHVFTMLGLRDYVRMDEAVLSKSSRAALASLQQSLIVSVNDATVRNMVGALVWIRQRCLILREIEVSCDHAKALSCLIPYSSEHLPESISLLYKSMAHEDSFVHGLHNIPSRILSRVSFLSFSPFERLAPEAMFIPVDSRVSDVIRALPHLHSLSIDLNTEVTHHLCNALSMRGETLTKLSVNVSAVGNANRLLCAVASCCPLLQSLALVFSLSTHDVSRRSVLSILQACPLLHKLEIGSFNMSIDCSAMEVFCEAGPLLRALLLPDVVLNI